MFSCYNSVTYSSSQRGGRDLGEIHRSEASVKAGVDPNDQTTDDQHVETAGSLGQAHQEGSHGHQDVVEEETALPAKSAGDEPHHGAAHHAPDAEDGHGPGPDDLGLGVALIQADGLLGCVGTDLALDPVGHDLLRSIENPGVVAVLEGGTNSPSCDGESNSRIQTLQHCQDKKEKCVSLKCSRGEFYLIPLLSHV